jgi:hypothetical protein
LTATPKTSTPRIASSPSTPADIPDDEPEEDVLEQRQEVPYREDDR